jgi:signal peptidase II
VLLSVSAVGLGLDLWTKWWAFASVAGTPVFVRREDVLSVRFLGSLIPIHEPVTVVPHLLDFTLVLNPGAVFGMGAGRRWFFVVFTAAALAFGLALFGRWTRPKERLNHAAIGLLLAGGLGNLYDRLVFACVRDFIHPLPGVTLPWGLNWPWGGNEVWPYVSNVADLWLIIGIAILLIRALRPPRGQ